MIGQHVFLSTTKFSDEERINYKPLHHEVDWSKESHVIKIFPTITTFI